MRWARMISACEDCVVVDEASLSLCEDSSSRATLRLIMPTCSKQCLLNVGNINITMSTDSQVTVTIMNYAATRYVHLSKKDTAKSMLVLMANALDKLGYLTESMIVHDMIRELNKSRENGLKILTSQIESLVEIADKRRDEIVLCLLGAPGIGKTEGIESFARRHGRRVVHIIASQILPTEVSGMTMPNQETHTMDVFDHARLGHLRDGDILFFDELLKGQVQVLNACLTLVQERRLMSGQHLPDVLIVAAANPLASPRQLPLEVRQRFIFVDVDFDQQSWCNYMRSRGIEHPEHMLDKIQVGERSEDTATWNVLTPRTATKLLLWRKSIEGSASDRFLFSTLVRCEFGDEVVARINEVFAKDEEVRKSQSPMEQTIDVIGSTINSILDDDTREISDDDVDRAEEVKRIINQDIDDINVETLLDTIGKMKIGQEVMRALKNETIEIANY